VIFHPDLLEFALQQGRGWLIPAILLAAVLCVVILVGVPRLLKNPLPRVDPAVFQDIPLPDRIRRWLEFVVLGAQIVLQPVVQVVITFIVLIGFIFTSAALLNLLADQEIISPVGGSDPDYQAVTWIAGGILLLIGLFLTFAFRAMTLGEEALADFASWLSMIAGATLIVGSIIIYVFFHPGLETPPLPAVLLFFLGLGFLLRGIWARSKI
jgi:hypothetical protein